MRSQSNGGTTSLTILSVAALILKAIRRIFFKKIPGLLVTKMSSWLDSEAQNPSTENFSGQKNKLSEIAHTITNRPHSDGAEMPLKIGDGKDEILFHDEL